jgi:Ser-tRNA(Ala) deacylase AlaX
MTDRLYYTDPYNREFDAVIVRRDGPGRVTLDRTSFYPTSGGQPFDTGTLGGARVVDVFDEDDGTISHVLDGGGELLDGQAVHGVIDWPRRFDHMQQHTGQHVLSSAFDRLFGARTVSFHLGAAASTIDIARELAPRDIAAAESEANRIVWEDRPVTIRFADAEEAATLPLRKRLQPPRDASLRDDERERVGVGPHEHRKIMIEKRRSKIHGAGVYATQRIPKNKRIIDYAGEKISNRESLKRERRYIRTGHIWCFKLTNRTVIDAGVGGNDARFINHSCQPNCYVHITGGVIWIRAARAIEPGEELTYHYNTDGEGLIKCRCHKGCQTLL